MVPNKISMARKEGDSSVRRHLLCSRHGLLRVTGGKESERSLKTSEQLKVVIILPPHRLSMHCPWKSLVPGHVLRLDTQRALPQFL